VVAAVRQGLKEAGYVEPQNLTIHYRWAEARFDRLPTLAADLVRDRVTAQLGLLRRSQPRRRPEPSLSSS
jgi:hypothetical protein